MASPDGTPINCGAHEPPNNPFDVVVSQGKYLLSAPNTPLFGKTDTANEYFATELRIGLERVLRMQKGRHQKYGEQVAEEWPQGHTPPEFVEARAAKVREMLAQMEAYSPPTSDDDDDHVRNVQVSPSKRQAALATSRLPSRLPTPSLASCAIKARRSCATNAIVNFTPPQSAPSPANDSTTANRTPTQKKRKERQAETGRGEPGGKEVDGQPIKARNICTISGQGKEQPSNTLHETAPWRTEGQRDGAKADNEETLRGSKRQRDAESDEESITERPTGVHVYPSIRTRNRMVASCQHQIPKRVKGNG